MISDAEEILIDRELASRSMADYIKMAWPHIDTEDYAHNWHMDAVCDHLTACHNGEINRLLINLPPGTSKSSAVSIFFPTWLWGPGKHPKCRFISASHDAGLARRDNVRSRTLIQTDWYQERWPTALIRKADNNVENAYMGFRQSSSVESMTGRRGHFVVWDDPHTAKGADSELKRKEAVRIFRETLTTRMINPKTSVIIIMMQRLHAKDVSGEILANQMGYEHLMLPMEFEYERCCYTSVYPTWWKNYTGEDPEPIEARYDSETQSWYGLDDEVPKDRKEFVEAQPVQEVYCQDPREEEGDLIHETRFDREVVLRDKRAMGTYAVAGQNQQRPSAREGGILKSQWFNWYRPSQLPVITHRIIIGDTGMEAKETNDPSCFICFGYTASGQCYLLDLVKDRVEAPGLKRMLERFYQKQLMARGVGRIRSVKVENKASGIGLRQTLSKEGMPIVGIPRSTDKVSRAKDIAAYIEAGLVYLPEDAPWVSEFTTEVDGFPAAKHDDQVDVLCDGVAELYMGHGNPAQILSALSKAPQA